MELTTLLFGSVLAVDEASLTLVVGVASVSVLLLALLWRPIVFDACDALFLRTGRLLPFLVAHFLIDTAVFVGYPWAAATWPALFGLPA